ncbi:putative monovalent cation/H+ antiporter subunit A [Oricola thermophila]|uniref:Putative monovalent cation/H+ antiporter subunit A n=1 Tax=Oricola thermophila TaxID=2742145 RepID=A0A6N1VD86_9HYPH|nr:putative monovalent cation/H+ antiporter subunit A [Oricola thermophila]QKV18678.1 putative monovalent cation/H+ antiporter subunit A [Oricola thermophila]
MTFYALFLPFLAALFAPALTKILRHNAAWVLALVPAVLFAHYLTFVDGVSRGERFTGGYQWIPSFNVNFSWLVDGLSLTFALLITGIGTLIVLYSGGYLKGHRHQGRFFSFILMFMGAMQGLVLSDSFLMLFVFWELTSITSFLLIGFNHAEERSRRSAIQALVVTGLGGLSLLAGLLLIWNIAGVSEMSLLLSTGDLLRESPCFLAAFILVLGGAFTKSAQFPFHFWLPNAMEAPTPVSAYLHSATMVKAGVYLLMRLNPVMGDTVAWETVLPVFGGTTLIFGTLLALRQTDLKLLLAYTTMASLGLLVMLTGFGTEEAAAGAVLYLIAHSMFKGGLFMVAGNVDHEAGTRDITKLGGLAKAMPITFGAALLAALSMGGLPPFFGFLAKEEIYHGLAHGDGWSILFTIVAIVGNGLMFAIGFAVALKPFLGPKVETPKHAHEGPVLLWAGPAVLAACGLLSALFSPAFHERFSTPMASAVVGHAEEVTISVVPHLGLPFYLSLATVAFGIVAYLAMAHARAAMTGILGAIGWGPDRGFDQVIRGIVRISVAVTRTLQNGRMETYMTVTFIVLAAAILVPMGLSGEWPELPEFPRLFFYEWSIITIAAIGLVAVVAANNRLTAIVSLGIQGFAVAVLFMLMGAPDLSFTQFMVETLSVVILALAMTRLRLSPQDHRSAGQVVIDGGVAIATGGALTLVLLRVLEVDFDMALTNFFNEYSLQIAHGRNIVNVILVDFRGIDTFGEIAVVMTSGLAILALIRVLPKRARSALTEPPAPPPEAARTAEAIHAGVREAN